MAQYFAAILALFFLSFLTLHPTLTDAKAPHRLSLHFQTQVGGDDAKPVLDHLQSTRQIQRKPVLFLKK